MRILVLGGTGAMGRHLCRLLANAGHTVFSTSRHLQDSRVEGLTFLRGNAKSGPFLRELLSDHWDAIVDFMVWTTSEFEARYSSLLDATTQYIFVSSYRVYADSAVITEDSPRLLDVSNDPQYLLTDEYALSKARCENFLFESKGTNWTIVRPAITYDSSGRFQLGVYESDVWLWRALNQVQIPFPRQMLDRQTTMTWGGDVARMMALLVGTPTARGEAFTLSTSEHHPWSQVADFYREVTPFAISPCALSQFERTKGGIYQIRYDRMYDRVIDNSKILDATGITQSEITPMSAGLTRELESYLKATRHPVLTSVGLHAGLDRILGGTPSLRRVLQSDAGPAAIAKYGARRLLG